jgi:ubiquitin-like modifier-activating enzyme 5
MTKTAAAKETLEDINPDVIFEEYTYDITTTENFEHFMGRILRGAKNGEDRVDLVGASLT